MCSSMQEESDDAEDMFALMIPLKAKVEHDNGDDVAAMRDLDTYIQANLADATQFTNSGGCQRKRLPLAHGPKRT